MTEQEAKAEHDAIQAEIAASKGIKVEEPKEETEEEDEEEPADQETDDEETLERTPPARGSKDVDPSERESQGQKIPLSKYQDTKKTLEGERDTAISEAQALRDELALLKTSKTVGEKVKQFSEKHGMDEAAVLDLIQLSQPESALTPEIKESLKRAETFAKKQEAEEKFSNELATFFQDAPEAAEYEKQIRAEAFKEGNLSKSLYEIYNRFVKPEIVVARKGGEAGRGSSRAAVSTQFDPKKIVDRINAGESGVFNGLTTEQTDAVFEQMEKTGSRYK